MLNKTCFLEKAQIMIQKALFMAAFDFALLMFSLKTTNPLSNTNKGKLDS